jgi:hypothetical protein
MWVKFSINFKNGYYHISGFILVPRLKNRPLSGKLKVFNLFTSLLGFKKVYKIQSFTFFIPSPPPRPSGYREKQFDKIFYEFINRGYDILNFTTQASTGEKQSGMWLVFIVQAKNKEAEALNLDEFFHDTINKIIDRENIDGLCLEDGPNHHD